jgi:hypothetical protein
VNKVVGIDKNKKPPEESRCLYCGTVPACYGLTCPRIASMEVFNDGTLACVEFHEKWKPVPPDAAKQEPNE